MSNIGAGDGMMTEEQDAFSGEPAPGFSWTTLEEAILDAECVGAALMALGTAEEPVEQRVLLWLGVHLSGAGQRLRGQLRVRPGVGR
jgi:hypothetical protein